MFARFLKGGAGFRSLLISTLILSFAAAAPAGADEPPVKVRLQLKRRPLFRFAGYYVAEAKGYYAAEGLDVEIVEGAPEIDPISVVALGDAEFGVDAAVNVLDRILDGGELIFLSAIFQHSPHALLSKADSGFVEPKDFIGKRVLLGPENRRFLATALFIDNGVPLDSIEILEARRVTIEPLANDQVDAVGEYLTTGPEELRRRGFAPSVLSPRDYGGYAYGDVVFTTREYYEDDYEIVAAFRRATNKGWRRAFEDIDEAVGVIRKLETVAELPDRQALTAEAHRVRTIVFPNIVEIGTIVADRLRETGRYTKTPERAAGLDYDDYIFDPSRKDALYRWLYWALGINFAVVALALWFVYWTRKLRKEVDQRTAELQAASEELKASAEFKDKLFSIVAHDLRGPFHSMLALSEALEEIDPVEEPDDARRFGRGVGVQARRVYNLLENLLYWSRSQTGNIAYEPRVLDAREAAEHAEDLYRNEIARKNVDFVVDVEPNLRVRADAVMLETIFRNLLSNALKYTAARGEIAVIAKRAGDFVEFRVRDTGVGMDPDRAATLFDKTANVSTPGLENESGVGLGLSLCKEFVERHGGEIRVESRVGKGTAFNFTLPVAEE
jgi:signal transduction histidine kinase